MKEIIVQKKWKLWNNDFWKQIQREVEPLEAGDSVCMNFSEIDELNEEQIPVVFVLTYQVFRKTKKPLSYSCIKAEVGDYLKDMEFFQWDYVQTYRLRDRGETTRDKKYNAEHVIPVCRIYNGASIRDFFDRFNATPAHGGVEQELCWSICLILEELMNNGQEHSSDDPSKMQVYAFAINEKDRINLVVADSGIGFYKSLLQNPRNLPGIKDHRDAVCQVLMEHISGRVDQTGGMGYITIEELIRKYNGRLLIVSGDAIVKYAGNRIEEQEKLLTEIEGSVIFIQLKKPDQ